MEEATDILTLDKRPTTRSLPNVGRSQEAQNLGIVSMNKQLNQRITSLEKTVAEQQSIIIRLEKMVLDLHLKQTQFLDSSVSRILEPESAEVEVVKSKMLQDQETQHLQELKEQVISTFTPELLCQAVKNDMSELDPVDQMIYLAKKADMLSQIQRSYDPSSNFWLDPKPLAPEVIASLNALSAKKQQDKINQFWQDITRIYNTDYARCTMFEVDNIISGMGTYSEKREKLAQFLLDGLNLQKSLRKPEKTSFIRGLTLRKKDKICKTKSIRKKTSHPVLMPI
jgi:uncharacterized coiled-coil protein SlyX